MRMGWGTGSNPTRVPCCRNLRISDSSVNPLKMQIFSTCGTRTCSSLMMVCSGNFCFHEFTQSCVATQPPVLLVDSALFSGGLPSPPPPTVAAEPSCKQ
ncbi:hypothetical protein NP493_369g04014 [Ridgeia piscesae]|uniref:Uncharacterized protein n=1 Tax=Ridgeia piscesae TaxID=27915 RepID=A0AAD9L2W3_RIDPI|nr:hypothetical protein NP493_369g04014 [Ridgeia piscesae]